MENKSRGAIMILFSLFVQGEFRFGEGRRAPDRGRGEGRWRGAGGGLAAHRSRVSDKSRPSLGRQAPTDPGHGGAAAARGHHQTGNSPLRPNPERHTTIQKSTTRVKLMNKSSYSPQFD